MPIPGSVLNTVLPFGAAAASAAYPSLATLRSMSTSDDTTGQQLRTFADSTDPAQQNLACRISPLIQVRPQNQESEVGGDLDRAEAKFQVNFMAYINVASDTLVQWQIKIDGLVYQIKAVEFDGFKQTTRLMISDSIPFNEEA